MFEGAPGLPLIGERVYLQRDYPNHTYAGDASR